MAFYITSNGVDIQCVSIPGYETYIPLPPVEIVRHLGILCEMDNAGHMTAIAEPDRGDDIMRAVRYMVG